MVKLAILFVCALLAVQHASAYRVKRDTPTLDDSQKTFEQGLEKVQDFLKNTFSQEQMKKIIDEVQNLNEKFTARGKELLEQADASIKKIGTN